MPHKMKIAIIGAGASGLFAAILLASKGFEVVVYEKNNKVGKKLLATGNGRCNITNQNISLSNFYSNSDIALIAQNIQNFTYSDCKQFFHTIGIEFKAGQNGRMYPLSLSAASVVDLLEYEALQAGVQIELNSEITQLQYLKNHFILNGTQHFEKVVIATGSIAMPKLGGTHSGYDFAKFFQHKIVNPVASLVQLISSNKHLEVVSGVKIEAVINGQRGDFLFTKYGVSGSLILDISRDISKRLQRNKNITMYVDTMPDFSAQKLLELLRVRLVHLPEKPLDSWLDGIMNKKLARYIILNSTLPSHIKYAKFLGEKELKSIVNTIKKLQFTITDTKGFESCEVCAGGVVLSEINLKNMESKHQKNLFFIGEVLDVDGDCGGYNLHWAWSSAATLAVEMC